MLKVTNFHKNVKMALHLQYSKVLLEILLPKSVIKSVKLMHGSFDW